VRSALNGIEGIQAVRLSAYADVYTLTFQPGVTPNEDMVRKVFKGCAFTGRTVELVKDPNEPRPLPDAPPENRTAPGRVALGRELFFDKRLSADGTVACSTCHQPQRAFTNGQATAMGLRGQEIPRNVPSLVNVGYRQAVFWDGRAKTLENMALGALEHPAVIDMTPEELTERLRSIPEYIEAFQRGFGEPPAAKTFALALAAYQRSLVSDDTPFDRFARGERSAISESARRGWKVFCDKANCITCHAGPDFTDEEFRTIGIGWNGEAYTDLGRGQVTGKPVLAGRFRVPILRELRWTAPYMHDGSLKTLEEVVDYYDRGGIEGAPTDLKGPIGLSATEKADLVSFLQSLSSASPSGDVAEALEKLRSFTETASSTAAGKSSRGLD
jgi:cytochrome c peroxidase